jgi:hypothetical protein
MNVFDLRDNLIDDYSDYISSFIRIQDERIKKPMWTRTSSKDYFGLIH